MITKISKGRLIGFSFIICHLSFSVACSDILDTSSELVEFAEDNTLDHPTDSVYSVMGIINRMQVIADRSVILGELRSDLVAPTDAANADLKRLAAFDFSQPNRYNRISDYYAVVNNCNFFLANVDTMLQRRGRTLFRYEYAAVKAFRAWTYLEMVKNYGNVPLVTEPVMTERQASEALSQRLSTIKEVCDYFIDDLTPYALVEHPEYGDIGGNASSEFFLPMRALLGDLCLWAGRYQEAARWYHDYLNERTEFITMNTANRVRWTSVTDFQRPSDAYNVSGSEVISRIPMESRVFDGIVSDLENVFSSTRENNYFYQVAPAQGIRRLSASQVYCMEYKTEITTDTVYPPRSGYSDDLLVGDLRLYSNYRLTSQGGQDEYSEFSTLRQTINKLSRTSITTYRRAMVYLRYAEALNRARLPQSAFAVLKYGLCAENVNAYVDSLERVDAGDLITFDETAFTRETVIGIHSLGSGDSQCNAYYTLPVPPTALATRQDTIDFQIPIIEDCIVNEMALEGAFEGYRFYDLMRVALRRGDPAYLANRVCLRGGEADDALRQLLLDTANWYLPAE